MHLEAITNNMILFQHSKLFFSYFFIENPLHKTEGTTYLHQLIHLSNNKQMLGQPDAFLPATLSTQ